MAPIDEIADVIKRALIDALKDREGELKNVAKEARSDTTHGLFGTVESIMNVIKLVLEIGLLTQPELLPALAPIEAADAVGGDGARGFGMGYFLGYALWSMAQPALLPLQHAVADTAQSEIFDPQTAAQLEVKRIIDNAFGRSEAAGGNLSGEHYDKLVKAALQYPDVATLLIMRDRSLITDDMLTTALRRHGYPDDWFDGIKGLSRNLLSPADLALAALRGNLSDEVARAYARILSITDNDFTVLLQNTGEPPGAQELMEALRRGYIDQARFERGIRQSRYRNEWLDVFTRLRYSPMTTSDAVRAVVENYLTDEQGKEIAQQNGLLPEHWTPLRESWGRPLSHEQMLTLHHRGQATLDDVRQAMRESDIKNKYIEKAIELGRHLIPERTIVSMVDHSVINHDTAIELLHEQGFTTADAERLIKLGAAQRTTAHKHLSRSDLVAMYEDRLMHRSDAVKRLQDLGYDHTDAEAALDLADYKAKASALRTTARGIEASLKAHHVTQAEAKAHLIKAGYDAAQAQGLIDQWLLQRGTPTRSLTEKQIVDFAGAKYMTVDEARNRLLAMGFARPDVEMILKWNGLIQ